MGLNKPVTARGAIKVTNTPIPFTPRGSPFIGDTALKLEIASSVQGDWKG